MKVILNILFVLVILSIGIGCGILIDKSMALADNSFWEGTANGMIVQQGDIMEFTPPPLFVNSYSVGQDYYPSGATFELKSMQVGELTYLTLYVHNATKTITNVYPVITATKNVEVTNPLSNCKIWPGGWAQFVFPIRALDTGKCAVNIKFVSE